MSLINVLFLGILPAGLLMWIGNMVRSRAEDDKAGNRWLLFLFSGLGVSVVTSHHYTVNQRIHIQFVHRLFCCLSCLDSPPP